MQDYSIVDYDRLEMEMKGRDARAVWRRLLSLPKLLLGTAIVCFYLFTSFLAFVLVQHHITGETPSVFGHQMYIAGDDSMFPAFPGGSLLLVRPAGQQDIAAGDIIVYYGAGQGLMAHRVAGVHTGGGARWFTTRGDALEVNDPISVPAQNLLGRVQYAFPFIGHLINFAGTRTGLAGAIIFPAILLIIFELRSLCKISARTKKRRLEERRRGAQFMLREPGLAGDQSVGIAVPSHAPLIKAKMMPAKAFRKINSRPAAGPDNVYTINHRESSSNGLNPGGQRERGAAIIMFRRKANAAVPERNPEMQPDGTPGRYFRSKQKAENLGRRKRYPNSRTRVNARSAYRYPVKSTEKFPT